MPTGYFIDWSEVAVNRLKTYCEDPRTLRGKAVIRNAQYYFRQGLTFSDVGFYSPTVRLSGTGVFDVKGSRMILNGISNNLGLAILCSKLGRLILKTICNHTVSTQVDDFRELPIPVNPAPDAVDRLEVLVDQILERQQTEARYPYHLHEQKKIDELIYQLYRLDEDDIREVELWYCRRYPKLAAAQGMTAEVQAKYAEHLAHAAFVMSKPASYWNSHPILRLIAQGESQRLEFKQTLEADATTSLANPGVLQSALKTIAAFANTEGGTLLIGVHDRGNITGLAPDYALFRNNQGNADTFEQKLRSLFQTRFTPNPYGSISIEVHTLPAGQVCEVTVRPVDVAEVVHLDTRDVYIRDGNGSRKLEGPALTRWLVQRGQQRGPG